VISVDRLHLRDFRSYEELDLEFAPGLTVVVGENGNGKTNLVEAIGFLARLRSFRGAPNEALVRRGASEAIIRGDITCGERPVQIEAALPLSGRMRVQVNKQRLVRRVDMAEYLTVTVFSPDDLEIVKGGPGLRRDFLDDLLSDLHPKNEVATSDFAKALRQRNALLKQMAGRRDEASELTLDVGICASANLASASRCCVPRPWRNSNRWSLRRTRSCPHDVVTHIRCNCATGRRGSRVVSAVRSLRPEPLIFAVACRRSARIETTSSCTSTPCQREPMRRKGNSARWCWRCG